MPFECADQIAVPTVEPGDDIVQRPTYLVLVESENALQHCARSGVLTLETFLTGDEKLGDDA